MGFESIVARRASLEDALACFDETNGLDLPILREMRELDDRLGLSPKGFAQLRWRIVADEVADEAPPSPGVTRLNDMRERLSAS